jgi:MFS family permease
MSLTPALYLASYAASTLGNAIAAVAIPLVVLQATGSVLATGTVAAAASIPAFLIGLVAGVVIDRINRRTSSIVSDLVSAAAIAALPIIDHLTGLSLGWFILFGILGSIGDVPGLTAREAMLPAIIRESRMSVERMMGLRESLGALMVVIGPAAAGTLMSLLDGAAVLWITAGTSFLAALLTLMIPHRVGAVHRDPAPTATTGATGWSELVDGWRVLFRTQRLLRSVTMLALAMVAVLTAMQGLVLPVHFAAIDEPAMLGLVLASLAAGSLVGGVLFAALGARIPRRVWLTASLLGTVAALAVIAALPMTGVLLAGAAAFGLSAGTLGTLTGVLMIDTIPERMRGRIMGTQNSLMMLAAPAGVVIAALAADWFDIGVAAVTIAVLWALTGLAALIAPSMRTLRPPMPTQDGAADAQQ